VRKDFAAESFFYVAAGAYSQLFCELLADVNCFYVDFDLDNYQTDVSFDDSLANYIILT